MRWKRERAKKERWEGWVGKGEMVTGSSRHVALWHRINMPNLGHYASHMSLWTFSHALKWQTERPAAPVAARWKGSQEEPMTRRRVWNTEGMMSPVFRRRRAVLAGQWCKSVGIMTHPRLGCASLALQTPLLSPAYLPSARRSCTMSSLTAAIFLRAAVVGGCLFSGTGSGPKRSLLGIEFDPVELKVTLAPKRRDTYISTRILSQQHCQRQQHDSTPYPSSRRAYPLPRAHPTSPLGPHLRDSLRQGESLLDPRTSH